MYTYLIGIKLETKKIEKEYYSIKNSIIFFEKKIGVPSQKTAPQTKNGANEKFRLFLLPGSCWDPLIGLSGFWEWTLGWAQNFHSEILYPEQNRKL